MNGKLLANAGKFDNFLSFDKMEVANKRFGAKNFDFTNGFTKKMIF